MERVKYNLKNIGNTLFFGVFLIVFSIVFLVLDSLNFDIKQILLFETMLIGIQIVTASLLKPKKIKKDDEPQNKPKEWGDENNQIKNFLSTKNSLISYYQNIASAQAVRLVGFTAGLFTLIGAVQKAPDAHLSKLFSKASILQLTGGIPSPLSSSINLFFLASSIFILFFFIFRAVFRYAAFSNLADVINYVKIEETENVAGGSLHDQIINALMNHSTKKYPRTVFKMPISYFFSYQHNNKKWWGRSLSLFLSISATFVLLLLIW